MSTFNPPKPLDPKIKEARLLRQDILDLQKKILIVTSGLLSRLDVIDPPDRPYAGRPKTRAQAIAYFKSL